MASSYLALSQENKNEKATHLKQAEIYSREALQARKAFNRQHGKQEQANLLPLLDTLFSLYQKYDDKETETEQVLKRMLAIQKSEYDAENNEVVKILILFGRFYLKYKKFEQAQAYLNQALIMGRKCFGAQDKSIASILEYLSQVYWAWSDRRQSKNEEITDLEQATFYLQQAKSIYETINIADQDKLRVAKNLYNNYCNLACTCFAEGIKDEGVYYYQLILVGKSQHANNEYLVQQVDCNFLNILAEQPQAKIYFQYGLILFCQHRFLEAAKNFVCVIERSSQEDEIQYSGEKQPLLDELFRREIQGNPQLVFELPSLAIFWLIRCYKQLEKIDLADRTLSDFSSYVEIYNNISNDRLLTYLYHDFGYIDEAGLVDRNALMLEQEEKDQSGEKEKEKEEEKEHYNKVELRFATNPSGFFADGEQSYLAIQNSSRNQPLNKQYIYHEKITELLQHASITLDTSDNRGWAWIKFSNLDLAKHFREVLHQLGFSNPSESNQLRKINVTILEEKNYFSIKLSFAEYKALMNSENAYATRAPIWLSRNI